MPTQIILIRHGETDWNKNLRIQGQTDIPLSPLGEEQARRLGRRLRRIPLQAAFTSDLARSRATADMALEGLGIPLTASGALRERNFGEWEGKVWRDIEKDHPQASDLFFRDAAGFAPPRGETWNQMQARVFRKIEEIAATHHDQNVAVFTHGGPCKAAILFALNLPPQQWRYWIAANASLHRLVWEAPGSPSGKGVWKLAGFNDVSHLEESEGDADPSSLSLEEKII